MNQLLSTKTNEIRATASEIFPQDKNKLQQFRKSKGGFAIDINYPQPLQSLSAMYKKNGYQQYDSATYKYQDDDRILATLGSSITYTKKNPTQPKKEQNKNQIKNDGKLNGQMLESVAQNQNNGPDNIVESIITGRVLIVDSIKYVNKLPQSQKEKDQQQEDKRNGRKGFKRMQGVLQEPIHFSKLLKNQNKNQCEIIQQQSFQRSPIISTHTQPLQQSPQKKRKTQISKKISKQQSKSQQPPLKCTKCNFCTIHNFSQTITKDIEFEKNIHANKIASNNHGRIQDLKESQSQRAQNVQNDQDTNLKKLLGNLLLKNMNQDQSLKRVQSSNQMSNQNVQGSFKNIPVAQYPYPGTQSTQYMTQPQLNQPVHMNNTNYSGLFNQNNVNGASISSQNYYNSQNLHQQGLHNSNGFAMTNSVNNIPFNSQFYSQNSPLNNNFMNSNFNIARQYEYKMQINMLMDEINGLRRQLQQKNKLIYQYELYQMIQNVSNNETSKIKESKSSYRTKKSNKQVFDSYQTNFTGIKKFNQIDDQEADSQYHRKMNQLEIQYINKFFKIKKQYLKETQSALNNLQEKMINDKLKQISDKSYSVKSKNNGINSEEQSPKYTKYKVEKSPQSCQILNSGTNLKFSKGKQLANKFVDNLQAKNIINFEPRQKKYFGYRKKVSIDDNRSLN